MKYTKLPIFSGKQLISILLKDGWEIHRRTRHGVSMIKNIDGRTRTTIIQDTGADIPEGTLADILSVKQTGIGKKGLLKIINEQ
jgi:predicted RNA binding protein YcfA (HicA-like mRNA interferase family)